MTFRFYKKVETTQLFCGITFDLNLSNNKNE